MKVYILTHCSNEDNCAPEVFTSRELAQASLQYHYNQYTDCEHNSGVFSSEIYYDGAKIIWDDDTYDKFQIFEVEL